MSRREPGEDAWERVADEAAATAAAMAAAAERRAIEDEYRAYRARELAMQRAEEQRIRRETAALLSGNSSGSRWYSNASSSTPSRSRPSPSWSSQYLSSDAQMRAYRQQLDRRIFGGRR